MRPRLWSQRTPGGTRGACAHLWKRFVPRAPTAKANRSPWHEHGGRTRHVGSARKQSQEQWGDDDDVAGAVLLEEPVLRDGVGMVVVITKGVDDGPADQRSIRREERITKPMHGPREEICQEIPHQEARSQPKPGRRCQQWVDQPDAEPYEHTHGSKERARLQHREDHGLIDNQRVVGIRRIGHGRDSGEVKLRPPQTT